MALLMMANSEDGSVTLSREEVLAIRVVVGSLANAARTNARAIRELALAQMYTLAEEEKEAGEALTNMMKLLEESNRQASEAESVLYKSLGGLNEGDA